MSNLNIHPTCWEHFTGKNPDTTFLPNDQERTQSAHILQQCLEHCPLSTQIGGFLLESSALQIVGDYSLKEAHAIKKGNYFFRTFGNFKELLREL